MIVYLTKNILENSGFKFVGKNQQDNKLIFKFEFEETDYRGDIDYKRANHRFNCLKEFFKYDVEEVADQTGIRYMFDKIGNCFCLIEVCE